MRYTPFEHVKILIAMLKAYNIKHIVLSPGNRNIPFVYLVEEDAFFHCYSIVDERSAAFFAIGLIETLNEPVAICCTSGTALCNYSSGVAEAFYQNLPLVVLTADRNPYYLNQNEDQMVPQVDLLKPIVKYSVQLPKIHDGKDLWYCKNQLHSAMLELFHGESGPVHIDFPIEEGIGDCSDGYRESIPVINRLFRYELGVKQKEWEQRVQELSNSKIMVIFGQMNQKDEKLENAISEFTKHFNVLVAADCLSNVTCRNKINVFTLCEILSEKERDEMMPDIIITINGNFVSGIKAFIAKRKKRIKHYDIDRGGMIKDAFRCIDCVYQCAPIEFFEYYSNTNTNSDDSYYNLWSNRNNMISIPEFNYSSLYVVKRLVEEIPENSLFHISNSTSVRLANIFKLKNGVEVHCNRGTNGIDGSCSSFIGNALSVQDKLAFLIVGDLSFFYDMNSLWNRYSGKNIRILLQNNEGAEIFHYGYGEKLAHINRHIAAEHFTTAKGWVEDQGYIYLSAKTKEEFEKGMKIFTGKSEKPIFFEVFTQKDIDAAVLHDFYSANKAFDTKSVLKDTVKKLAHKSAVVETGLRKLKNKVEK